MDTTSGPAPGELSTGPAVSLANIRVLQAQYTYPHGAQHRAGLPRYANEKRDHDIPKETHPRRCQPKAHAVGRWGEDLAARILETNGYRLLDRNWRLPAGYEGERAHGEIDAIAIDPDDELVFIEIKTRTDSGFGHPLEAIGKDKARRTRELAILWCRQRETLDFGHFRIDAVSILGTPEQFTFEHLKGVA